MKNKIIAELAQGFEGDLTKAKLLVNAAASSGADIVKLQLVYADELATPDYLHYKLFKSLEMPDNSWKELLDYSKELNGLTVNLLVNNIRKATDFITNVIEANIIYEDIDFAAIEGFGSKWCFHADHTYDKHPLRGFMNKKTKEVMVLN